MKKKTKTIQLQIENPCSQNWNEMTSIPGGRFCDHCEKTVVDFRAMSDLQAVRFYQKSKRKVCGIFRSEQLNKDIPLPPVPGNFQRLKAVGALVSGLMLAGAANAQTIENKPIVVENVITKPKAKPLKFKKCKHFTGIVLDENGDPLPYVNIVLSNSELYCIFEGTTTDKEGYFKVPVRYDLPTYQLNFTFLGYESHVIQLTKQDLNLETDIQISLKPAFSELPEIVVATRSEIRIESHITGGGSLVRTDVLPPVNKKVSSINEGDSVVERVVVNILPNPFLNWLQVEIEVPTTDSYLFHLYNVNGRLVFAETVDLTKGPQSVSLDFTNKNLPDGTYFLRISDTDGEIRTKKLVKGSL